MESQRQNPVNNVGLFLTLAGVVIYILVDSGLVEWPRQFSRVQQRESQAQPADESQLLQYAERLGSELKTLDQEAKVERNKLKRLQDEVKAYENNIQQKKFSLAELDNEIRRLSSLKTAVANARANVLNNQAKTERVARKLASMDGLSIWKNQPTNVQSLVEKLSRISNVEARVEEASIGSSNYSRIVTELTFDPEKRIYPTPKGMFQVRALSEGAILLGYKQVTLAHDGAEETLERIRVLKSFLDQAYGQHLQITSSKVQNSNVDLDHGLEIWLKEAR